MVVLDNNELLMRWNFGNSNFKQRVKIVAVQGKANSTLQVRLIIKKKKFT